MHYTNILPATFLARPNRFIAHISIQGHTEICHVKNTGRCKELLVPGAKLYVQASSNPDRKTKFDLISVQKGNRLINMDSQAPNKVVAEWLNAGNFPSLTKLKPEFTYKNSRLDFAFTQNGKPCLMEVKGVTLEENDIVRFPDAPTERGVKHLHELIASRQEGYSAYMFFVIQMKSLKYFTPNWQTHPAFGEALQAAAASGVKLLAYDCQVTKDTLLINDPVKIIIASHPSNGWFAPAL